VIEIPFKNYNRSVNEEKRKKPGEISHFGQARTYQLTFLRSFAYFSPNLSQLALLANWVAKNPDFYPRPFIFTNSFVKNYE
jgi:hypothetical protein